jgi:NAD(P)-dependent dehydrogenase (short-subunit alcohol dehydrogenase family)
MSSSIAGQVAIVTGAARGLGESFSRALRAAGAEVVGADVLGEVNATMASLGGSAVVADVSTVDGVQAVLDHTMQRHGRVDILIANAAIADITPPSGDLAADAALYDKLFAHNVRSVFLCGRAVMGPMRAQGNGNIIIISTDHGFTPPHKPKKRAGWMDVYDATKTALEGFIWGWSHALAPNGIRVNGIGMGETDTPMLRNYLLERNGKPVDEAVAATWTRPDDIARVVVELIEEGPAGRTGKHWCYFPELPVTLPVLR